MSGNNPLLLRSYPTKVRLHGEVYPLRCTVMDCLPIIMAYEDEMLTAGEQQEITLQRLYGGNIPSDREAALRFAVAFLDGGGTGEAKSEEESHENESPLRLYSFARDGGMIYSAFRGQYGIDLQKDELHWWAFLALFHDLSPDCRFYQILHYRKKWLEGTLSREEQQLFEQMGPEAMPPAQPGDKERDEKALAFLRALGEEV